jgi:hypothetical protein
MTNEKLMQEFLNGATKGKAGNLKIEGDKLIQYSTTIAQRVNGQVIVNVTKYSKTTTVLQNKLTKWMPNTLFLEGIPQGTYDITRYITQVA